MKMYTQERMQMLINMIDAVHKDYANIYESAEGSKIRMVSAAEVENNISRLLASAMSLYGEPDEVLTLLEASFEQLMQTAYDKHSEQEQELKKMEEAKEEAEQKLGGVEDALDLLEDVQRAVGRVSAAVDVFDGLEEAISDLRDAAEDVETGVDRVASSLEN